MRGLAHKSVFLCHLPLCAGRQVCAENDDGLHPGLWGFIPAPPGCFLLILHVPDSFGGPGLNPQGVRFRPRKRDGSEVEPGCSHYGIPMFPAHVFLWVADGTRDSCLGVSGRL